MVGRAQGQVPDESDDGLHQRPPRGRVHQPNDGGEAALKSDGVLGQVAFRVSRGQVSEGAHRRLGDLLSVPCCNNCPHQGFDASHVADHYFVLLVVARQVGKDSGGASHDVHVVRPK